MKKAVYYQRSNTIIVSNGEIMAGFYIISGDDDFARKRRAREICAELSGDSEPETNEAVEIISGDDPALKVDELAALFVEALRTPPFLCDHKIIWMRHHPDLDKFAAEKQSTEYAELFALLTAPLPDGIQVIIDGPGLDRRRSKVKELKNAGAEMELLNAAKSSDKAFAESRRELLANFSRTTRKRIAPDAMQYLSEVIGGDSGTLANELEKLNCYTGNATEITLADCQAIISRTQEALSWEFTSAVVENNRTKALLTLAKLLSQRDSGMEIRMLAGLSNEYQKLIQTRLAMKQLNISRANPNSFSALPPDVKDRFPDNPLLKMHPYRAFKTCEAASRFSGNALAIKLTAIRDASRALVSGGGDSRILLEMLVAKLCQ